MPGSEQAWPPSDNYVNVHELGQSIVSANLDNWPERLTLPIVSPNHMPTQLPREISARAIRSRQSMIQIGSITAQQHD